MERGRGPIPHPPAYRYWKEIVRRLSNSEIPGSIIVIVTEYLNVGILQDVKLQHKVHTFETYMERIQQETEMTGFMEKEDGLTG